MKSESYRHRGLGTAAAAAAAAAAGAAAAAASEAVHGRGQRSLDQSDFDEALTAVLGCKPDPDAVPLDDLIAYDAGFLHADKKNWVEHRLRTSFRAVHDLCLLRKAKRAMAEDVEDSAADDKQGLGEGA